MSDDLWNGFNKIAEITPPGPGWTDPEDFCSCGRGVYQDDGPGWQVCPDCGNQREVEESMPQEAPKDVSKMRHNVPTGKHSLGPGFSYTYDHNCEKCVATKARDKARNSSRHFCSSCVEYGHTADIHKEAQPAVPPVTVSQSGPGQGGPGPAMNITHGEPGEAHPHVLFDPLAAKASCGHSKSNPLCEHCQDK